MADNKDKEKLTPADYDRWGRTCVKFYDDPPKPSVGTKLPIDEELEKLFEQMDRENAKLVNNQGCPTKRVPKKK